MLGDRLMELATAKVIVAAWTVILFALYCLTGDRDEHALRSDLGDDFAQWEREFVRSANAG